MDASKDFRPEPSSVRAARRMVSALAIELTGIHDPSAAEVAELLTSELATNAVLHAATPFRVSVTSWERTLRVAVRDQHPAHPTAHDPPLESTSGRGVALVEALSHRWGVDEAGDGKVVWFELDY